MPPVLISSRSQQMMGREGSGLKSLQGDRNADAAAPANDDTAANAIGGCLAGLRSSLGLVLSYSCSYNLLLLAPSIYLLQIYDRVLSSRSGDTLLMLTLIVAFTVVIGGVLDALRRAALGRIGEWLEEEVHPAVLSACFEHAYEADRTRASAAYRDLT